MYPEYRPTHALSYVLAPLPAAVEEPKTTIRRLSCALALQETKTRSAMPKAVNEVVWFFRGFMKAAEMNNSLCKSNSP